MSYKLSTIIAQTLEPGIDAAVDDLGAVAREIARMKLLASIAVSLKRIADAMEAAR